MILTIRTDTATARLALFKEGKLVAEKEWEAGRQLAEQLLEVIKEFCKQHDTAIEKLDGLVVFRGPGSFTGLRIGATVANTIAYALKIPIVGALGENWEMDGISRLAAGETDVQVIPEYGALPNITKPRK
ncbi:MAG TPA: tRNA (adenosine(37)-N6)-threonylcarbamoyltransferase complex dimerization subunit type 1 TsaB [Candidatus Saccharimonadales bacterium]|nr:tRNA (adenosine(37)-N6)-threonylcarbamoyltransferase complex dimerization subunit type 1 TsaB [Candidatus Saccharimonadales bacterium]